MWRKRLLAITLEDVVTWFFVIIFLVAIIWWVAGTYNEETVVPKGCLVKTLEVNAILVIPTGHSYKYCVGTSNGAYEIVNIMTREKIISELLKKPSGSSHKLLVSEEKKQITDYVIDTVEANGQ